MMPKKSRLLTLLLTFFMAVTSPTIISAREVIVGGQNIGIELRSNGLLISGTYDVKEDKKILISVVLIILLVLLCVGISFAVFNYSNNNAGNNGINSGHISMTYTEPSNEYIVENALPMKDEEGKNSTNYFEFSVTTTAPTNDTDDEGVSIPYEITITESEGNTLTNDKIKMYLSEVEGDTENTHTVPTFVSYFEPSLYKDGQIKVGFNLHLHRNGNETVTTKYRLRAWIDNDVDVSDWDTANKYQYKFKVNVNGEATYQGYSTDQSCFTYSKNNNSRNEEKEKQADDDYKDSLENLKKLLNTEMTVKKQEEKWQIP